MMDLQRGQGSSRAIVRLRAWFRGPAVAGGSALEPTRRKPQ
ncbi:hypothetical protein [Natronosalvus caseinilyticus]|nr:hypothetical protein [Natronosalvus caseinilyticus]